MDDQLDRVQIGSRGPIKERNLPRSEHYMLIERGFVHYEDSEPPSRIVYLTHGTMSREEDILYHYTNFRAFESIVKSKSLWLTKFSDMNDPLEYKYAIDLLQFRVSHFIDGEHSSARAAEIMAVWREKLDASSYFVGCFSQFGDSLSQWREYSELGGVSLGLSRKLLSSCSESTGIELHDVIYDRDKQKSTIDPIAKEIVALAQGDQLDEDDSKIGSIQQNFARAAIKMKQPGYHYERESRLTLTPEPDRVQVRPGNDGREIEFVSLDLAGLFEGVEELDVIWDTTGVAPSDNEIESLQRIQRVYADHKMKFREIACSKHRYRWPSHG